MNTITAADRCDRCGAQAYLKMEKGNVSLLFCAHHSREHKTKLIAELWIVVVDDTAKLQAVL